MPLSGPPSIAKSTHAIGGQRWAGRGHLCDLTHPILQVRKLRPLAPSCTTSKSPEPLSACSVPRETAQWSPEARGTEALPAGSSVRAVPALSHRTRVQQTSSDALHRNSGHTASPLSSGTWKGGPGFHSSVFHQLFIGSFGCQGKQSLGWRGERGGDTEHWLGLSTH